MRPPVHPASRVEEDSNACDRVADWMSEYLDGELEAPVARAVAVHLSRCSGCARQAAELALTIAALHRLSPARGVTLGWLAGPFRCGAECRPATPRFPAVRSSSGERS